MHPLHSNSFSDLAAFLAAPPPNFSGENGEGGAEASRSVSVGCSLHEFVQHQEIKNTPRKTQRDVSLLKKFLVSRNELREIENIDARDLDV